MGPGLIDFTDILLLDSGTDDSPTQEVTIYPFGPAVTQLITLYLPGVITEGDI